MLHETHWEIKPVELGDEPRCGLGLIQRTGKSFLFTENKCLNIHFYQVGVSFGSMLVVSNYSNNSQSYISHDGLILSCRTWTHQKRTNVVQMISRIENHSKWSSLNSRLLTRAGIICRILFFASSSGNTTMRCHNNWSLNYTSKVSAPGRLIHHSGEARRFELAAVSAAALKAREACLKLRCKAGLAAKFSATPRSVTRVHVQGLF